jgi:hypothetical protein
MTTLLSVKKRIASWPWPCSIPKNDCFIPLKGKNAMGARARSNLCGVFDVLANIATMFLQFG